MNHYMLPLWNGDGLASPKYGNIAIDKLIQKMLQSGAQLSNLEAKIFGGGNIIQSSFSMYQIGDRNIEMAYSKLQEYGIEIIKSSTGGNLGRKILMDTGNFKILHKFIEKQNF
ncbi:MAG: chemotaxis protein CheD [Bacteroidales bacterium]|nr:chemotaxis protein CheD [Bacteroidales bacterium]